MSDEQMGVDVEQEGVEKASKTVLEPFFKKSNVTTCLAHENRLGAFNVKS